MSNVLQVAGALLAATLLASVIYAGSTFAFNYYLASRWRLRDIRILEILGIEWLIGVGALSGFVFYTLSSAMLPFELPGWASPTVFLVPALAYAAGTFRYIYYDYIPDAKRRGARR
ncbi:MAG: hypothetical protein A3C03_00500 [Candidatus Colwellbacteria bacterium RIFCSPHIGHO2_02_FULL_45_17]|nr:MAG: hypothetical protein A3C03_00500 [Candidatus Colwellbacteria bacterium RIFCSPHIGHO2_02_FULL_45_17]